MVLDEVMLTRERGIDDAVIKDTTTSTFTDPTKVRKVEHSGRFFKSVSAHQVDPSPQRTPLLFQAGMSPAGSAFAAKRKYSRSDL